MNLSYLDWYLVELRQHLHGRVSAEQEESLLAQSRMHLEALTEELKGEGLSMEGAEKEAALRFGRPEIIAQTYVTAITSKPKRLSSVVNIFLALALFFILVFSMFMLPFEPLKIGVGIVFAFAFSFFLIGLVTKRAFSRKTFLTVASLPILFGLAPAVFLDFYQSPGEMPTLSTSTNLERMRERAVKTRAQKTAFEDSMKKRWEQVLNDPKLAMGLAKGETYALPAYQALGSRGVYISAPPVLTNENGHMFTAEDRVVLKGYNIDLGKLGERKPETLTGPMTLGEIKSKIDGYLNSINNHRAWDNQAIAQLTTAANQGVVEKLIFFAGPTELLLVCFALPIGLLTSFLGAKFARRTWKRKGLQLA